LNGLENTNLQFPWSLRSIWLESSVVNTNPLTLKMVYSQTFSDSSDGPKFVHDSIFVKYNWNKDTKTLVGDYSSSKISKEQVLTYQLDGNELLFINAYYKILKQNLSDERFKKQTINYLNEIMNSYRNL
jgi:hypothetical protein